MSLSYAESIEHPDIPTHLNVEFLQEVAEKALRINGVRLEKAHISMGSKTGENFFSWIYRVQMKYKVPESNEIGELSVICKCMHETKVTEFLEDLAVFRKEQIFYTEVLPRMEILIPRAQRLGCRLLHSLNSPIRTHVLEDLNCKGYSMACRNLGLDEAHCRLVMQRLGQFHATSLILAEKDNDILKCFESGWFNKNALEKDTMLFKIFEKHANALLEAVSKWPGYEQISFKIQKYVDNLKENLWRSQAPLPDEFRVLNHGDLWVNNMLFKYKAGKEVEDVLFLDLQLSVWGSPGIDLNYFFYTSMKFELLQNKRQELIKEYHKSLSTTLNYLHYKDIPTLEQIVQEVHNRESFGFIINYAMFSTIAQDKEHSTDSTLENFANEDFAKRKLQKKFSSKRFVETLRYTLKQFEQMGVLT